MAKLSSDRLDKFKPQTRNANKHTQRGMGTLETSMRKYGYVSPMTAAADGEIIDGSARIETSANVFGDDVIVVHHDGTKPVIMVRDDIPSADTPEARAISIAANRVAALNLDFDAEVLFEDLQAGIDLGDLWRKDELADLFADLLPKTTGDTEPQIDRAEELREKWQTAAGQLWQLGEHRLICGDCTDPATVARVMAGERAQAVVTDPPYGVNYTGGTGRYAGDTIKSGTRSAIENDADFSLYRATFDLCLSHCDDGVFYVWYADKLIKHIAPLIPNALELRAIVNWYKVDQGFGDMGAQYHNVSEPCLYLVKGAARWKGPNNETNVWEYQRPQKNELHPTEKPLELIQRMIANHDAPIVADWFSGSGTTIIACENLHRRCRACEISPAYVAVALERWAQHTGGAPVLLDVSGNS